MSEAAIVTGNGIKLTPEQERRRRARSVAIGLILAGVAVLFFVITYVKLGGGVVNRPL